MHVFMYVLFVKNEGEGEGGRGLIEGGAYLRRVLNRGFTVFFFSFYVYFFIALYNAFSVRSRLCFDSKIQLNTVVYNILSYRSVSRSKTL